MLVWRDITIDDRDLIEKYFSLRNSRMVEHCFADIFIWRNYYRTRFAVRDGFLFLKGGSDRVYYLTPCGEGDLEAAVRTLIDEAAGKKEKFMMVSADEYMKDRLGECMPGVFEFTENRDGEDYIYCARDLIELTGKKYHSKRNFDN